MRGLHRGPGGCDAVMHNLIVAAKLIHPRKPRQDDFLPF